MTIVMFNTQVICAKPRPPFSYSKVGRFRIELAVYDPSFLVSLHTALIENTGSVKISVAAIA